MYAQSQAARHLAWHETLEMHELAALQAIHVIEFKMQIPSIQDPTVRGLYTEACQMLEQHLRDFLPFYQLAPVAPAGGGTRAADMTAFYAGHLLGYAKNLVRCYAIGITETATPALRDTFQRHLLRTIQLHAKVFYFMLQRGYYPAYQLDKLLATDLNLAKTAMSM